MELISAFMTEAIVALMLGAFGMLARSFFNRLTGSINDAVKRVENVGDRVHKMEVKNAERLAELGAHVQNIYKRLDRDKC